MLEGWKEVGRSVHLGRTSNQGLATVAEPGGARRLVYRGDWSIPRRLRSEGWVHIGDPDGNGSLIFDAYQGAPGAVSKMFAVTGPVGPGVSTGIQTWVHRLTADEMYNNSFAAVTPDGQWLVSGEWGRMERFLVFPTPAINLAAPSGAEAADLPLVATITLDRPVRNVQGAAFVDSQTLLCSTDDPGVDLWPVERQLLEVRLAPPLGGGDAAGTVRCLGPLPLRSLCAPFGSFEVEGLDYDRESGDLRVAIVPPAPCGVLTTTIVRIRRALPA